MKLKGKWLSGLRRQTVNLLIFIIAGSNPAFPKLQNQSYPFIRLINSTEIEGLDNIMVMYWIANPVMTVQVRL